MTSPLTQAFCTIYGCTQVPNNKYNLVQVTESSSGAITVVYDVTQSKLPVFRPNRTVNGWVVVSPTTSGPVVIHKGDGFPSEELYWFGGSVRRQIFQKWEGPFWYMDGGTGDWYTLRGLPQS